MYVEAMFININIVRKKGFDHCICKVRMWKNKLKELSKLQCCLFVEIKGDIKEIVLVNFHNSGLFFVFVFKEN